MFGPKKEEQDLRFILDVRRWTAHVEGMAGMIIAEKLQLKKI